MTENFNGELNKFLGKAAGSAYAGGGEGSFSDFLKNMLGYNKVDA